MSEDNITQFIQPSWSAPAKVHALCTTRQNLRGISEKPFDQFNLATHVGDKPKAVEHNRLVLFEQADLPNEPVWLDQQHTNTSLELNPMLEFSCPPIADASWTTRSSVVCTVMTADCLPILITDSEARCVAAIHAGWKGLAKGIVSKTVLQLPVEAPQLMAWIGPAISLAHFEVGQDVLQAFVDKSADNEVYFQLKSDGKYMADLPGLAAKELQQLGLKTENITLSGLCSYADPRFYSYRREGTTGRMASLIWLQA